MDKLSAAHVKALEFEREQLLKQRHWQRLVNQAKREERLASLQANTEHTREKKVLWIQFLGWLVKAKPVKNSKGDKP